MTTPLPRVVLAEFVVPGIPVSAQAENRSKLAQWKAQVAAAAAVARGGAPLETGPCASTVTMYAIGGWKLDLDNMAKPILDAMTGVVWVDDRQLVTVVPGRRELDGPFVVMGMSRVLADGFVGGKPFVHVAVLPPPDLTVLP